MATSVLWFRRDLRLGDNPALLAAREASPDGVLPLFVLDDVLRGPGGAPRLAFLYRCLRALDGALGGRLVVRHGRPEEVVPAAAREVGAGSVHLAADHGRYGRERDQRVAGALPAVGACAVRTGSPYAVAPGRVRKDDGTPFRVYTPFYRAWMQHGWREPAGSAAAPTPWLGAAGSGVPPDPELPTGLRLPEAGEAAALARWAEFKDAALHAYRAERDRPDRPATSRLSVHLKYGTIHPRTMLADLALLPGEGEDTYRKELAWREFYADVLWQQPRTVRECLNTTFAGLPVDTGPTADERFAAWAEGRTGYPVVDAGMRQLRADAWVHNRVRMIVASFLVKDLHLDWQRGAREFMRHLVDGDTASNHHGWQWVAGCGTDAAPFFRVFNPVTQGRKFDPDGDYVRRYVPELRSVPGGAVHEPWTLPGGPPAGYPERIVDHAAERREALARYERVRG